MRILTTTYHFVGVGWALLAFLVALPGAVCAQTTPSASPLGRDSDRLFARPDLQQVAAWQAARNTDALVRVLSDPEAAVRARAAFALGSLQDSSAVPALTERLRDPEAAVRADAAFALGQSEGKVSPRVLLRALRTETDAAVQTQLLEALGKQGSRSSLNALVAMTLPPALAPAKALAVGRYALRDVHTPAGTAYVLDQLGHSRLEVRQQAAYYFARSATAPWAQHADRVRAALDALPPGDPAAAHLLRGLSRLDGATGTGERFVHWLQRGTDWRIRTEAARALAPAPDSAQTHTPAFDPLANALSDPYAHVGIVAAEALAARAASWTPEQSALLQDWMETHADRWRVGAALLPGFARAGSLAVVERQLDAWQKRGDVWAYAAGLGALGEAADSRPARRRLLSSASAPDVQVAAAALNALAEQWRTLRSQLAERRDAGDLQRAYYGAFAEALRRDDLAMRYYAAPLLADSLFQPLGAGALLRDVYAKLRVPEDIEPMTAILAALGQAGGDEAAPLLREATAHPHPVARQAAADALRTLTGENVPPAAAGASPAAAVRDSVDWAFLAARGPHPQLVLATEKGTVTLRLDAEEAPLTAQTLMKLAERGAYDGVPFHRVVPNFVAQGGDVSRGDGFGGPGFAIPSEFTRLPYARHTAGIASAGKDTEGSQFFVTHSMQPHLDGRYTAFGVVERGQDVIDRLYVGDRVLRATVQADR